MQAFRFPGITFRSRSSERDRQSDIANVAVVAKAINDVLKSLRAERDGLSGRVADVLSRAAIAGGNDVDEYVTRDAADTNRLNDFDAEILNGQKRLEHLDQNIVRFDSLKAELLNRFPEFSETIK